MVKELVVSKHGDGGEVGALARKVSLKLARPPLTQVVLRPSKNASKKTIEKFTRELRKTSPRSKINLKSSVGCIECSPGKIFSQKSEMCIRKNGKAAKKQGLYTKSSSKSSSKGVRVKRPVPPKTKAVKASKPKTSKLSSSKTSILDKLLSLSTTAPEPVKPPQTIKLPTPPTPAPAPLKPPQTIKSPSPPSPTPTPLKPPQTIKSPSPPTPAPIKPPQTIKSPSPPTPAPLKPPQTIKSATPPPVDFKTLCKSYFADRYVYLHGFRDIRLTAAIKECGGKIITSPMNNRNTIVIYWKDQPKTIFTYRMMISYAELVKKLNFSGLPVAV